MADNCTKSHGSLLFDNSSFQEDMKAFDQLDPRLRAFMRELPIQFSAASVLACQHFLGVTETLRQGRAMLAREFPGWSPV